MLLKIVLTTLFLLFLQHILRLLYIMGYHVTVYNHSPGPCRIIPGVEHGSEDIETLPNGLTFITSGIIMPMWTSSVKKYYDDNKAQGKILLFDFKVPDNGVRELPIHGNFNKSTFRPHGISVYQNPDTGKIVLFVVNHPAYSDIDYIEKFEYKEKDQSLEHIHSYTDDAIRVANDVAATGEDSFYFTNYAYYPDSLRHKLEVFLFMSFGSVVYFDGKTYTTVADGFLMPNGIIISKDGNNVYLACSFFSRLHIFKRENDNSLTPLQMFPLYSSPDNIIIDPETNNLLIGAHPVGHMALQHIEHPGIPAPSKVFMVNMRNGSHADNMTELYSDDGHTLWASTVASIYDKKMLIGTIKHKLLFCEVRVL